VRWDRLARMALLCVLVALVYLYLSAGLHLLATIKQSHRAKAAVAVMEAEHGQLTRQHQALSGQAALEAQARQLGMMRKGEQPYVVGGLPKN
jgi:cell division protein FtsB